MSIQGWRPHIVSGQPVALLSHSVSEKGFPDSQMEPPVFQIVPVASGRVTGYCWEEPGSVLFSISCLYTLMSSTQSS